MNNELEARIQAAVEHAAPDLLERVLLSCSDAQAASAPDPPKRKKRWLLALPAAAVLAFCLGLFYFLSRQAGQAVDSVVMLDVNPCVSLMVSAGDRVLDAQALNEDGQTILGNMELRGVDLETAVNALIGSMLRSGYLSSLQNSILISVEAGDGEKAAQLQSRLTAMVDELLRNQQLNGSVLSQSVTRDDSLESLAAQYDISIGKAALIQELAALDAALTVEELVPLSVNELALILDSRHLAPPALSQSGTASDRAYIGQAAAVSAACAAAGLASERVLWSQVEFDSEDGVIVYDVELQTDGAACECKLNAATGEVLSWHIEYIEGSGHHSGRHQGHSGSGNQTAAPGAEQNTNPAPSTQTMLTAAQAEAAALNHAGVSAGAAGPIQTELDFEDGRYRYELEFQAGLYEYEYVIDAYTGAILEWELGD